MSTAEDNISVIGPPQGRGVRRGAPSKNGGAGIPGLGPGPVPGPAKSGCEGSRPWLGWPKKNQPNLDCLKG